MSKYNKEQIALLSGNVHNTNKNHARKHYIKGTAVLDTLGDIDSPNHNITEVILALEQAITELKLAKKYLDIHRAVVLAGYIPHSAASKF